MRIGVIVVVVAGLIFLGSSLCLANGGAPVEEPVEKAGVYEITPKEVEPAFVSQTRPTTGDELKSPGLATLLSVICPGLGQVYNGDINKAVIMGSGEALSWVLIGAADMDGVGIFGLIIGRIISPVDAYYSAVEKNMGFSLKIDNEKVILAVTRQF